MTIEEYKIIQEKCKKFIELCDSDNYLLKIKLSPFRYNQTIHSILDGGQECIYFSDIEGSTIFVLDIDQMYSYALKMLKQIQIYKLEFQENNL